MFLLDFLAVFLTLSTTIEDKQKWALKISSTSDFWFTKWLDETFGQSLSSQNMSSKTNKWINIITKQTDASIQSESNKKESKTLNSPTFIECHKDICFFLYTRFNGNQYIFVEEPNIWFIYSQHTTWPVKTVSTLS